MKIMRILFGEKTPDEDNPKYKKLREESEATGRKAAEITGMGKFVAKVQRFAENNQKVFLFYHYFFAITEEEAALDRTLHALSIQIVPDAIILTT